MKAVGTYTIDEVMKICKENKECNTCFFYCPKDTECLFSFWTGAWGKNIKSTKNSMLQQLEDLLTEFEEMGFAPTTLVPNPEKYAKDWRKRLSTFVENIIKNKEN